MEKKNVVFLTVLAVATLLTAVVGTTFAYFTATVTGNDTATTTEITTAQLGVTYDDGSALSTASLIIPGWSEAKTISVTNTSNVDVTYTINWTNVSNTFVADVNPGTDGIVGTADDGTSTNFFVYSVAASATTTGTAGTSTLNTFASEIDMPTTTTALTTNQSIKPGETHTYVVTMKYKEAGYPQDANQNKSFSAKFQVAVQDLSAVVQPGN